MYFFASICVLRDPKTEVLSSFHNDSMALTIVWKKVDPPSIAYLLVSEQYISKEG